MIPHGVEVFVSLDPINMAFSFDRLAGLVQEQMGRSARDAALFVFFNRRRTAIKALFADGSGLCVFYKRLDRGRFCLPEPVDDGRVVELSERELDDLLDGIAVERGKPAKAPKQRSKPSKVPKPPEPTVH